MVGDCPELGVGERGAGVFRVVAVLAEYGAAAEGDFAVGVVEVVAEEGADFCRRLR